MAIALLCYGSWSRLSSQRSGTVSSEYPLPPAARSNGGDALTVWWHPVDRRVETPRLRAGKEYESLILIV